MSTRPLTADEQSLLKTYTQSALSLEILKASLFGWLFLGSIVFAVIFSLWKWVGPEIGFMNARHHGLEAAILSFAACGAYIGYNLWKARSPNKRGQAVERDLAAGVAIIEELDVLNAVEIAEYEDEGAGFLLELSDGRVLCVIGQDLYDYAHDFEQEEGEPAPEGIFPSNKIIYVHAPQSGIRLEVKGTGEKLEASRLVKAKKSFYKKDRDGRHYYAGPEDATFYPGTLQDVLKKFGW